MRTAKRLAVLPPLGAVALALVATTGSGTAGGRDAPPSAGLLEFDSCREVVGYARKHRRALPGGGGLPVPGVVGPFEEEAPATGGPQATAPVHSGTNVQEAGVDEADIVKTDGELALALAGGLLHSVDVASEQPQLLDSLPLNRAWGLDDLYPYSWPRDLLFHGDRALVFIDSWPRTVLAEIDVSNPANLRAIQTFKVEGAYVSSRLNEATARVVVSSFPEFPIGPEQRGRPLPATQTPGWLPAGVLRDRLSGQRTKRALLPCPDLDRPQSFSGLEMLSVLTIDLSQGLPPSDVDSLMSGGQVVYGSPEALYVATERWLPPRAQEERLADVTTEIHKFDLAGAASTEYAASGEVAGFMLNQWSLSEREGLLRVASTIGPRWLSGDESESYVTVLEEADGALREVGSVGGLGEGERIYAVRFIDDVGFVVTFRQVDPLYTIDLSVPSDPTVLGKLKIPGFSAYLHPIAEDLLLGIGRKATEEGQVTGAQLSLFDVSDLANPTRIHHADFDSGFSSVDWDHRAFLHWPPKELAVVPLEIYGGRGDASGDFNGAIAFSVGASRGIEEVARISHGDGYRSLVQRSFVVGDRLYTLSERGLKASDLQTFAEEGWVPFGADEEEPPGGGGGSVGDGPER